MQRLALFAVVLAFLFVSSSALWVTIRNGTHTKRSIVNKDQADGSTVIMVTRSTNMNGKATFTRHFYKVADAPVPRVVVRKVTGTFSLADNTISALDVTKVTHAMWFAKVLLYNETNGVQGFQLHADQLLFSLNLTNTPMSVWTWTKSVVTSTDANGVNIVNVTRCATASALGGAGFCLSFHTGDGQYRHNNNTVFPGMIKVDKTFIAGQALTGIVTTPNIFMALASHYWTTTDNVDNGTLAVNANSGSASQGDESISVTTDYTLNFTSGDVGFLSFNKYCTFNYANGTSVNVTILIDEVNLTDVNVDKVIQLNGPISGTLNAEGLQVRRFFIFDFMQQLPITGVDSPLSTIVWDPAMGTSDQNMNNNAASSASVSMLLMFIIACLSLIFSGAL